MRPLRPLPLAALLFGLACGDDDVAPCEIQQLDIQLTGTLDDLESGPRLLGLEGRYTPASIDPIAFEYLAQVLGHNAPTGSGSSAVFSLTGPPDVSMGFQLGGSRIDGTVLAILGVMSEALVAGEGPPISAIPRNGLLLQFGTDDFAAISAEGEITVTRVAPLEGTLHVELLDGAGRTRVVDGLLVVIRTGPGC
jgi:hypothetical protein